MIVTISGLTGCGKNTLGELLSKELGYKLVCPTFKDLAKKEGVSLLEFQKMATRDPNIDKKFDDLLQEKAKGNCVVTTWLGPWMLEPNVCIKLFAPLEVRAERVARRDGMKFEKALEHVKERDNNNRKRYKKIYGIEIDDSTIFDACLNSGVYESKKLLEISLEIIKQKMGG